MLEPTVSRRLSALALWPFGVALTSWRYLWRTTPIARREHPGDFDEHAPPPLAGVAAAELQLLEHGAGDLFHRRYRVRMTGAKLDPEGIVRVLIGDLNQATPTEIARFLRRSGDKGLVVGDELVVHMPGPWNGPVRVVDVTKTSFRLATLFGHLEAGQIEFRALADGGLTFEIESWARSGDRLSKLLYQHARMAKEIQLHMWTSFLEQVVKLAGGKREGRLEIETHRCRVD